jgi:hypothetical protein
MGTTKKTSLLPDQEALHPPLGLFYGRQLSGSNPELDQMSSVLAQGSSSPQVQGMASNLEKVMRELSLGSFKNEPSTGYSFLNSRNAKAGSQARGRLAQGAKGAVGGITPELIRYQMQGLSQQQQLRFLPYSELSKLAITPTVQATPPQPPSYLGILSTVLNTGSVAAGYSMGGNSRPATTSSPAWTGAGGRGAGGV